jgi:hypothetical protein
MTHDQHTNAPVPDLRIVPADCLHPHEWHDSQRSNPLVERLRGDSYFINPPIVAPIDEREFVILDGANRCHAITELNYPHILVQVMAYEGGYVELDTWNHVISDWDADEIIRQFDAHPDFELTMQPDKHSIAHLILRDGGVRGVHSPVETTHERNAALSHVVNIYQQHATLYRTAIAEPAEVWQLYPKAIALMVFPRYEPADIIAAAHYKAFLPPGISRHIVHGRAIQVNYPMERLRDESVSLADKNAQLQSWLQSKLANRQVRYYAEATYQFDE